MVGEVAVQLVASLRSMMSVKDICKHFGIARSTYYRWKQASTDARSRQAIERRIGDSVEQINFAMATEKLQHSYVKKCASIIKWFNVSCKNMVGNVA
ncbi:hypothetical protein LSPH24S_02337 [Lysinibacillus sphaericus]